MPTENMQVNASNCDAEQDGTAVSITIPYGRCYSTGYVHGYRFVPGTSIPSGATIDTATLSIYFYNVDFDDIDGTVHGEDAASPGVFTTGASDISNRTQTTASASVDFTDVGISWQTVDVKTIIEELVGDYTVQAVVIIIEMDTSQNGRIRHWDGDTTYAAKLDIVYTVGGFPPVPGAVHRRRRLPHLRM